MKKRTRNLSICIALLLLIQTVFLTSASVSASSATPTGAGTSAEPYMLTSAEQFSFVASHPDSYFRMANDIDFSGISDFSAIPSFSGVLDGNGKEIQNLHISADGTENAALFNTVTSTGIIQDLTFINPQLSSSSGSGAGALAINLSGTVRNVGVIGGTISTTHSGGFAYAGGLAVYASAKLTGCFSVDTVITGISTAGGLIGQAHNYSCVNCYSTSTVNAPVGQTGGLIGVSFGGGALEHCYANGSVNGSPATSRRSDRRYPDYSA